MLYNNLKKFIKKIPTLWKFLRWIKDNLIKLSRLKDVAMMMIMFQVWPEQTYRFSTRRHLPCKKNRFSKESKQTIPYDLLKSKCSSIPIMDEINIVGLGSSFDLNFFNEKYELTNILVDEGELCELDTDDFCHNRPFCCNGIISCSQLEQSGYGPMPSNSMAQKFCASSSIEFFFLGSYHCMLQFTEPRRNKRTRLKSVDA